jgi:hypothetical protein
MRRIEKLNGKSDDDKTRVAHFTYVPHYAGHGAERQPNERDDVRVADLRVPRPMRRRQSNEDGLLFPKFRWQGLPESEREESSCIVNESGPRSGGPKGKTNGNSNDGNNQQSSGQARLRGQAVHKSNRPGV